MMDRGRVVRLVRVLCVSLLLASGLLEAQQPTSDAAAVQQAPADAAAAGYAASEALRRAGRCAEALDAYQDVIVAYPRSPFAGRAELGTGRCLIALDRAREAMRHLQRVHRYAKEIPRADVETALQWNTILARLHLRGAGDPAFTFAGRVGDAARPVRDVLAMAILPGSAPAAGETGSSGDAGAAAREPRLAIVTEQALLVHDAHGTLVDSMTLRDPRGLTVDAAGRPVVVLEAGVILPRAQERAPVPATDGSAISASAPAASARTDAAVLPLRVAASGGAAPRALDDLAAACVLGTGEIVAADRRGRAIHRFDADGQHRGVLASINAVRLAANERDEIVAIERDTKAVVRLDAQGKVVHKLLPRGDGYQFDEPVDVAIDPLGHIYVLDRGQAAVWIFGRDARLVAALRSPEAGDGMFRQPSALAVDAAGRVYVHDERLRHVVIYQ